MAPVTGPASSTDNAIARWDGTSGTIIQDSTVIVDDSGNTTTSGDVTAAGNISAANISFDNSARNLFVGTAVGPSVTSADGCVGLGYASLYSLTSGVDCTGVGTDATYSTTSGNSNTGCGYRAVYGASTGSNNTGVGSLSLANVIGGSGNTAIGSFGKQGDPGPNIVSGMNNTMIGYLADANTGSPVNRMALGYNAIATTDNTVQIGNSSVTAVYFGASGTTLGADLALAGSPTTTTQSASDNSTKIATTAYVDNAVSGGASASSPGFCTNFKANVTSNTAATVSANLVVMVKSGGSSVSAAISSTLDLTGTGLNKLDTGSLANSTWYYLWAVSNGTTSGVVASTSSTAPNSSITSSYPYYTRLAATLRTNGSAHLMATMTRGRKNQYVVGGVNVSAYPAIATGAAGTFTSGVVTAWSSQSVSSVVPTNVASDIKMIVEQGFNVAAYVSPNNSTAPAYGGNSTNPACGGGQGGNAGNQYQHVDFLLESSNVYYAGYTSGSGIYCVGWEDNL